MRYQTKAVQRKTAKNLNEGEKLIADLDKYFKTGDLASSSSSSDSDSSGKSSESVNEFWDPFKEKKVEKYKNDTAIL